MKNKFFNSVRRHLKKCAITRPHPRISKKFYSFLDCVVRFCLEHGIEYENIDWCELACPNNDKTWGIGFDTDETGTVPIFDKVFDFIANNVDQKPYPGTNKMGDCLKKLTKLFYDVKSRGFVPHEDVKMIIQMMEQSAPCFVAVNK